MTGVQTCALPICDDEIIVYSVGGMPVEDIAWGGTVYRNAVKLGIGIKLPLLDKPEMA